MDKTRIAIIGLGGIAQLVHLPILNKQKNVTIEAVAELNKNKLNSLASKFNIKNKFQDYKELISNVDFDAAIIATPTNTHKDIAVELIKAKKPVLIEKPIALNYAEAKEIYEATKKYKTRAMVGLNLRFRPDAMLLKSLINSGELGEIFYIKSGWLKKQSSSENWFMKKQQSGGGVVIDLGISLLDLALWLLDYSPAKSVSVQTFKHQTSSVEDSAVGFLRFENSSVIHLEVSWSLYSEKDSFTMTTFGTEGTAHLNPLRAYKRVEATHIDYTSSSSSADKNLFKKSYENELKHFIGAVKGNNPFLSSIDEAMERMKILKAVYLSAEKNSEILIKEL